MWFEHGYQNQWIGLLHLAAVDYLRILQFNLKPLHIPLPHSKIPTDFLVTLPKSIYVILLTKYFFDEDDSSEVERSLGSEKFPIIALQGANHLLGVLSNCLKGMSRLCPLVMQKIFKAGSQTWSHKNLQDLTSTGAPKQKMWYAIAMLCLQSKDAPAKSGAF